MIDERAETRKGANVKIDLIAKKNWTGRVLVGFMFDGDKTPLAIPGDEGKSYAAVAAGERFAGQFKRTSLLRGTGDGGRGTGDGS